MKPRPEIVAVPTNTTVEQFVELLREQPFSRVPVFEGTIHNIKGIVYAQDVLQVPDTEARTRTVDTLMRKDVYFVPESKRGSDLLREMQKNNVRMAIVVDEYGGVAGLVTIEDLVEEIVGEIRDEHEKAEVIRESDHSYVVAAIPMSIVSRTLRHAARRQRIRHRGRVGQRTGGTHSASRRSRRRRRPSFRSARSHRAPSRAGRISPVEPTQMKLI